MTTERVPPEPVSTEPAGTEPSESPLSSRVPVIGLGNPLLGDDGIGWAVVDAVERRLPPGAAVELDRQAVGGLTLMERLVGYRRAVLVDAIRTGAPAGSVSRLSLDDLGASSGSHLDNAHDATLQLALAAGRAMGAELPDRIDIVAIEAERVDTFELALSPAVAAAVEPAADAVLEVLGPQVLAGSSPTAGRDAKRTGTEVAIPR